MHTLCCTCGCFFGELSERFSVAMAFLGRDIDILTRSTGQTVE